MDTNTRNKIINKIIAMSLILTLTMIDFIFVSKETYAIFVEENTKEIAPIGGISTQITNNVEKYLQMQDGVLLQIAMGINLQKDSNQEVKEGKIEINVPKINNELPRESYLINISNDSETNYENGTLTIKPSDTIEGIHNYKIVYIYSQNVWAGDPYVKESYGEDGSIVQEQVVPKTPINWKTTVSAQIDNQQYSTNSEENVELYSVGTVTNTNINVPQEIYKGKMYLTEGELETTYAENIEIETSYINTENPTKLNMNASSTQLVGKDGNQYNSDIYYKTTKLYKENLKEIFANENQEFELNIKATNEEGTEKITTINEKTEGDEIIITYPPKTTSVEIVSTSNINSTLKAIKIENEKTFTTNNSIENIEMFAQLKETVKQEETTTEATIELKEPVSNASIQLKDVQTISGVNGNSNIGLIVTLNTNSIERDILFSNTNFTIKIPEGIYINNIENIDILASNSDLAIQNYGINKNGEIYIQLQGTQTNYIESEFNTQILLNANVNVEKTMANKVDRIEMIYANKGSKYRVLSDNINVISSNEKIVTNLKLENYNGEGATIENYSNESNDTAVQIGMENEQSIQTPVKYTIINNYDVEITTNVTMTANIKIEDQDEQQLMNISNQEVTVEANSIKTIEQVLEIPANLYYNTNIEVYTVTDGLYTNNLENKIKLSTETRKVTETIQESQQNNAEQELLTSKITEDMLKIETVAKLGDGTILSDKSDIYNEQIIEYTIKVTNTSNETLQNLNVNVKQTNGNIYGLKEVEVINFATSEDEQTTIEHEYAELDTNETQLKIDNLQAGETKEVEYKAVAKMPEQNAETYGEITISSGEYAISPVKTITNIVRQTELKISTTMWYKEEYVIYTEGIFQVVVNVENLTEQEMENIKAKVYLSENLYYEDSEIKGYNKEDYSSIEIENTEYSKDNNCIEFNIKNLEANEKIFINVPIKSSLPLDEKESMEEIYSIVDGIISNKCSKNIIQRRTSIDVKQTTNIEEEKKVREGEKIIFTADITNTGNMETLITVEDRLEEVLKVEKVTLTNDGETTDETASYIEGEGLFLDTSLEAGKTMKIEIETTLETANIATDEVENTITIGYNYGEVLTSNVKVQTTREIDDSNESDIPDDPNIPIDISQYHSISGVVWLDINENGIKDENEGIENVQVKIIDTENQNTFVKDDEENDLQVTTNANGEYTFTYIPQGNYNIIFIYDTSKYGIKSDTNIKDYVLANGKKVGITGIIALREDRENIDLQLYELEKFNLKLDKYITRVSISTSKGIKDTTYDNKQLVKTEIASKLMSGSVVLVEYTLKVTNNGELPGYATEIIDYLPKDMKFTSEMNTQWYIGTDGNLYNSSLSGELINTGESKEVKLILVKTMTDNNVGTTSNKAKISKMSNSKDYTDIDLNDNESKADILINVSTGIVIKYTVLVMSMMVIIMAGVFIIKKKVLED